MIFKKIVILSFFCISFLFSRAQSFQAQNWTKTDCNGKVHTLFDYLDSNQVVLMEFGMGCTSCTDAAADFSSLKKQYALSHPGKVKFFYMDYWESHTCINGVNSILGAFDFDAGFDNCAGDLTYYTPASPMTFVVIVAGASHSVIYNVKKYIYENSDSVIVKNTINNFFNTIGIKPIEKTKPEIKIYPNPASGSINLEADLKSGTDKAIINIYNTLGAVVKTFNAIKIVPGKNNILLNVAELSSGNFFVELIQNGQKITSPLIIKN